MVASFANIFFKSVGCLFILFIVSFAIQQLLSLSRSHLFIFYFISIVFVRQIKKDIAAIHVRECSVYVSLWGFPSSSDM